MLRTESNLTIIVTMDCTMYHLGGLFHCTHKHTNKDFVMYTFGVLVTNFPPSASGEWNNYTIIPIPTEILGGQAPLDL